VKTRRRRRRTLGYPLARIAIGSLRRLPPGAALAAGAAAGRSWFAARGPRVREARINLAIAFPDLDPAERDAILRESLENLGRSAAEVALLHGRARDVLLASVDVEGEEHLEAARRASPDGGVLALSAHFGSWELGAAALAARGHPLTSVQRERSDPRLARLVEGWREDSGQEVIALGRAGLAAVRALRRGRALAVLLDQNARRDEGVFAPFFGVDACTRSAPARLAMRTGVPVLPVFFHRRPGGGGHVARIAAALEIEAPGRDSPASACAEALVRNVARMNRAIEKAVRSDPAQWAWVHRRFRTRPPGAPRIYPSRHGRD